MWAEKQYFSFFFLKRKFVISVWIFIKAQRETLSWQKCLHTLVNKDLSKSLEMWVLVIAPSITVYVVWVSLLIPLPLIAFTHKIRTMAFIHSLLWNTGRPLSWDNWVTVSGNHICNCLLLTRKERHSAYTSTSKYNRHSPDIGTAMILWPCEDPLLRR